MPLLAFAPAEPHQSQQYVPIAGDVRTHAFFFGGVGALLPCIAGDVLCKVRTVSAKPSGRKTISIVLFTMAHVSLFCVRLHLATVTTWGFYLFQQSFFLGTTRQDIFEQKDVFHKRCCVRVLSGNCYR